MSRIVTVHFILSRIVVCEQLLRIINKFVVAQYVKLYYNIEENMCIVYEITIQ